MAKGPAVVLCVVATTIVLIPFRAFTQQAQTPAEWKPLEAALGRSGKVQPDGAFKFGMPRKDLKVTVGDVQIKPGFALGAWAAFSSSGDDAMVMGDMVLTEDEVPPVIDKCGFAGITNVSRTRDIRPERMELCIYCSSKKTDNSSRKKRKDMLSNG